MKIRGLSEMEKKTSSLSQNVKAKCKEIFEQQRLIITQLEAKVKLKECSL